MLSSQGSCDREHVIGAIYYIRNMEEMQIEKMSLPVRHMSRVF